ncbi:hypothetical protein V2J74_10075 [Pseudomonas alliivorans]|nr:hypothetical protein [Pseudomonas alliivorans]
MSKHPIPDWLRSQFSRIEDEVHKLGPCGVFTQMRTVTQTYFEQAAAAPQPPALGGEHQSKLLKLAANLANRRPLRPLQDLCERQSSIKTSRLIEYVEMCGDTLAAIALDIRNHTDACRAPLLAEIASERELRRELGVRVHQLKDELKDVAQLKARNAELESALKFYADREHYHFESGNWDTVSGEPLNILWCGDEPDFIEDGSVARNALSKPAGSEQV